MALRRNVQDLAATIAFWAFFSIFPLLIGILAVTGYFLQSAELQARLLETLVEFLPGSAPLVEENIETVMTRRGALSWIAIVGLLWSAGRVFGAITRAINQTLGTERKYNFLVSMARQFLMAVALSVMVTAAIGIPLVIEILLEPTVLAKLGLNELSLPRLEGWVLSFVIMFLVFSLIYRLAPYEPVDWRDVLPGALLAALAFELCKAAFVIYLDSFANFESVYGPLTSIIVLLLWLYVSALILILGSEYSIARWQAKKAAVR